jgi:3-deoxy-D-manno-octulosonic-acid transferase
MMASRVLYNVLVLPLMRFGASVASPFVSKIRTGLAGRRDLLKRVQAFRSRNPEARIALFHCASAGELEGIRPLARAIRARGYDVAVTYFSPSAKQAASSAREFTYTDYSPVDRAGAVAEFYDALKPSLVLISKHDVWPNMVWKARERAIPVWLVNGNFHPRSMRAWPIVREFHRAIYSSLTGILAVSEADAGRARRIAGSATRVESVGDSRFDRVLDRAERNRDRFATLRDSLSSRFVVIAGSTHEKDEQILLPAVAELQSEQPDLCLIVVPHDPTDEAANRIRLMADALSLQFMAADGESAVSKKCSVILLNRGGVLADLYAAGALSFVGGAFDRGVHSVIEPMAHGLPVICGISIAVSQEAREAQSLGLLSVVSNAAELGKAIRAARHDLMRLGEDSRKFVAERAGVARSILRVVLDSNA